VNGERQQHTGLTLQSIVYLLWGGICTQEGWIYRVCGQKTTTTTFKKTNSNQQNRKGCKLANNTVLSTARLVQTASILHDF